MDKYLDIALRSLKDRADKYDKARTEVKIDGGTRAHYIVQRDAALEDVERLQAALGSAAHELEGVAERVSGIERRWADEAAKKARSELGKDAIT